MLDSLTKTDPGIDDDFVWAYACINRRLSSFCQPVPHLGDDVFIPHTLITSAELACDYLCALRAIMHQDCGCTCLGYRTRHGWVIPKSPDVIDDVCAFCQADPGGFSFVGINREDDVRHLFA